MKTIEETMSIIHQENNHRKIKHTWRDWNTKKQPPPKACSMMSSQDKMTQYRNFSPHQWFVIWTTRSTTQAKQQTKFWKPTITIISDLNSNWQLPKPGNRRNFNTHKTCWKYGINDKRLTGKKHTTFGWDDGEKICQIFPSVHETWYLKVLIVKCS